MKSGFLPELFQDLELSVPPPNYPLHAGSLHLWTFRLREKSQSQRNPPKWVIFVFCLIYCASNLLIFGVLVPPVVSIKSSRSPLLPAHLWSQHWDWFPCVSFPLSFPPSWICTIMESWNCSRWKIPLISSPTLNPAVSTPPRNLSRGIWSSLTSSSSLGWWGDKNTHRDAVHPCKIISSSLNFEVLGCPFSLRAGEWKGRGAGRSRTFSLSL